MTFIANAKNMFHKNLWGYLVFVRFLWRRGVRICEEYMIWVISQTRTSSQHTLASSPSPGYSTTSLTKDSKCYSLPSISIHHPRCHFHFVTMLAWQWDLPRDKALSTFLCRMSLGQGVVWSGSICVRIYALRKWSFKSELITEPTF